MDADGKRGREQFSLLDVYVYTGVPTSLLLGRVEVTPARVDSSLNRPSSGEPLMRIQVTTIFLIAAIATASAWGQGTTLNQTGGVGQGLGQGAGQGTSIGGLLQDRGQSTVEGNGFLNRTNSQTGFLGGAGANANGGNTNRTTTNFGNAGGFTAGGGGRGGAGGVGGRGGQPQQQRSTRVIRTRITIPRDFGRVTIEPNKVQSRLNGQYRRVSRLTRQSSRRSTATNVSPVNTNGLRGSNVVATPNGRSVTLTGRVASERDRVIAEKIAKMEPGVDSVVNQIIVSN